MEHNGTTFFIFLSKLFCSTSDLCTSVKIRDIHLPSHHWWSSRYFRTDYSIVLQESSRFLFMVTDVDETQKTVRCVLRSVTNDELCKAPLRQWVPSVEDEGLKNIEVKNNDTVILQVFFDQKSLYIRPASSSLKDMFCHLIQDAGVHCIKRTRLTH
jgi:hypothetical protein